MSARVAIIQLVGMQRLRTSASLDGITALPDHSADGAAVHVYDSRLVHASSSNRW